jgi:glycosyltransferase involved in cell wall biosynthesis
MRIGLDLRSFLKDETGIGVYFKNLLLALAEIDKEDEYFMLSSSLKVRFPKEKLPDFARSRFHDLYLPGKLLDFLWFGLGRPAFGSFFRQPMDLTHSSTPLVLPTAGKTVVTVHDLFYMDHPKMTDEDTRKRLVSRTADSLARADGVIAVSKFTRDDLLEKFHLDPAKITVIHHGTNKRFRVKTSTAFKNVLRKKHDLPTEFLLFVGAVEPRKNLTILVDALKILHLRGVRIPLIIAGRKGSDVARVRDRIVQNGLGPSVRVMDYLPDEDVQGLYSLATLFVFPSLCEGFGFPLLEAMASGVPIAASRVSALPEVAGDAALYFDPDSAEQMAGILLKGLEDEEARAALIEQGRKRIHDFDWERSARATLEFYRQVAGQAAP